MKITVVGGTGFIGAQVVRRLTEAGHTASPVSLSTGVDVLTGQGLDEALAGADVMINLTNSPTFDEASLGFFETSMRNLLAAGDAGGVRHHVILSILGVDRVPQLDYFRAKVAQEDILRAGSMPYSIVRSPQFFEFMDAVMSWTTEDHAVRLPSTALQPVAGADVASAIAETAMGAPVQGIRDIAGPEVYRLDDLGRRTLAIRSDSRTVVTDEEAGMFGSVPGDVLVAGPDAELMPTRYEDWLRAV